MNVIRLEQCPPYKPAGHAGVVNRLLVGRGSGGIGDLSVWHGTIQSGGFAEPHVHEGSLQAYVAMTGAVTVAGESTNWDLQPGDAAVFSPGERHAVSNRSGEQVALLVISTPALR
jgi:mannose-6-phosphate isomerase-like protein (cupin superfamily)